MFFRVDRKTRWPSWPLVGWDIFDFSFEIAERNLTKLDRKQDLNALYQVCVLRADQKNKMAALVSEWRRHFRLLLSNRWTEFNETRQEARSQHPLPSLRFFGPIGKIRWSPWPLNGWDIFWRPLKLLIRIQRNSTKFDRKQDLNVLYHVCVFSGRSEKTRGPLWPLIDWNIFDLPWKCWTELNETWQEARSQRPLKSFFFSGRSGKQQDGHWSAETFSTSPLKRKFDREYKISTFSTKFVCFGSIGI